MKHGKHIKKVHRYHLFFRVFCPLPTNQQKYGFLGIAVQGMYVYEKLFAFISHFFCFLLYYLPLCFLLNMRTKEIYSSNTTLFVVFNYSYSSFYNQCKDFLVLVAQ